MGIMYAWATKEYLLWEMTIGQIILYFNKGMEIKYPSTEKDDRVMANISDLKKIRDEMKAEKTREELEAQYGAIDG
jgi:hypothetical protein